jgi:hypothetical protein
MRGDSLRVIVGSRSSSAGAYFSASALTPSAASGPRTGCKDPHHKRSGYSGSASRVLSARQRSDFAQRLYHMRLRGIVTERRVRPRLVMDRRRPKTGSDAGGARPEVRHDTVTLFDLAQSAFCALPDNEVAARRRWPSAQATRYIKPERSIASVCEKMSRLC